MTRRGFTRVEFLIVVVILGIVAAEVTPQFADAPSPLFNPTPNDVRGENSTSESSRSGVGRVVGSWAIIGASA